MKIKLLLLCENVIFDNTGKVSLIGIFHNIDVRSLPAVHGKLELVGFFDSTDLKEEKEFEVNIKLLEPGSKELVNIPSFKGKVSPEKKEIIMDVSFNNIQLTTEGIYNFEVYLNGEKLGNKELTVKKKL